MSHWITTALVPGAVAALASTAFAQDPGSGVRAWTQADTDASRAARLANPPPPLPPMPPRPTGHEGLSDRDLYFRLSDPVVQAADSAAAMAALARLTREEKAWMRAYSQRLVEAYIADRDAGRLPSQQVAAAPSAPAAPAIPPRTNAVVAPPPQRPGDCRPSGECYFAVVAHHGDEPDAYRPSYEGTRLGWGIQVSDTASGGFSVPFTICGLQLHAPAAQEANIRGRLSPTSESAARRYSLSPHGGGFAICSWSPPRYTGPNR